ncbi:MAG TPA: discoidin domain-containing protein, partial [Taishania sp.]|nr:discoidin domain-containing protein [Taishania sp.]
AVIDFERREEISSIAMNFIQTRRQRVFYPEKLIISVSDNGKNYREIGVVKNQSAKADSSSQNQKFELKLAKPIMARYIQVKAAISDDKFILTDEIIIY